jgi:hypothetical protein
MRIHPEVKLRGDRNECPTCGALFDTSEAFDAHRVGNFATRSKPNTRRCLSATEMHYAGFRQNRDGFLLTEVEHKYRPAILKARMDSQSTGDAENSQRETGAG